MNKTIYSIIKTEVYDGDTIEPKNWCFSSLEKAFEFYKKLIKDTDKDIPSDWVCDGDFDENKMETGCWERYEDGYYEENNVCVILEEVSLDLDYDGNLN